MPPAPLPSLVPLALPPHLPPLANVGFPAPAAAYQLAWLLPASIVVVLAVEIAVLARFADPADPPRRDRLGRIAAVVLLANVCSWLAGVALTAVVAAGPLERAMDAATSFLDPDVQRTAGAWLGFLLACVLSFLLEVPVLAATRRWTGLARPWAAAAAANAGSYVALGVLVLVVAAGS